MNPFSLILGLPILPLRGVIRLADVIQRQAERELHDPAAVRRILEEADEAKRQGRLSDTDAAQAQQQALDRMISPGGAQGQAIEARHSEKGRDDG